MDLLLSVVVPVYKEEANIVPFLERTIKVMEENGYRYEILFCLDPSPDNTYDVICDQIKNNPNIRLISFSRRFGQPSATLAGIFECKGDACIVTDVDLQDPPELMKEMVDRWINNGSDVVYAQRKSREGEHLIKKAVAYLGYHVINKLGEVRIPVNTGDFRLMDRKVIEALRESKERHGFLRGMVAYVGFKQEAIPFDRDKRLSGKGNYNPFFGSLYIGLNGIICYSKKTAAVCYDTGHDAFHNRQSVNALLSHMGIARSFFNSYTSYAVCGCAYTLFRRYEFPYARSHGRIHRQDI